MVVHPEPIGRRPGNPRAAQNDRSAQKSRSAQNIRRAQVRARLTEIESCFGDPWDQDNPVGYAGLLAADRDRELSAEGLKRYERLLLNAEFVPRELGGRLVGLDALGLLLRPLFRRDASLAVGGALTSFMAAMQVWLNGDPEQQRRAAGVLLGGGVLSIAFQQFAHGNDFVNDEFRARRSGSGLVLSGRKAAVNNAARAELMVAFARTAPGAGPDSHSLLLVAPGELPAGRMRHLDRQRTDATPGLEIAGLEFDDCPLPSDALVGGWGQGLELGLRAYPMTHATVPAMLVGLVDTALRTAARAALAKPDQRPLARASSVSRALAGTFTDLLVCDSLALTATRALHLIPGRADVLSAAAKYVAPKLVGEALHHLSVVLGDAFHARDGEHAIFRKHLRDLDSITFGHVSSAMCQATIAPCLPGIAAAPWTPDRAAPDGLFRPYGLLPPLVPGRPAGFGGRDGLAAYATAYAADPGCGNNRMAAAGELAGLLGEQIALLAAELREIRAESSWLDAGPGTPARAFQLSDRYALALAAVSCLGVWHNADPAFERFSSSPEWLVAALDRLLRRLGRTPPQLPASVEQDLCVEVLGRTTGGRSLDLYDLRLAG